MFDAGSAPGYSIAIIVAFTAGFFSLLGSFAGAALTRRTEYEKWVRSARFEAFAKYLELMDEALVAAINAFNDPTLNQLEQDTKVTDAYVRPVSYARVVALYLPKNKRETFHGLAKEAVDIHASRAGGQGRVSKSVTKVDAIAKLFESTLDD